MKVHLVDGTYELFRAFFGAPPATAADGREVGATRGSCGTLLALLREARRHARRLRVRPRDRVVPERPLPRLQDQRGHAARAAGAVPAGRAAPRTRWASSSGPWSSSRPTTRSRPPPRAAREAPGVEQVVICSPDKDLAQCVRGDRVVCFDRRQQKMLDEAGVVDQVRRAARVDPGLAGPGRRHRGRLSRDPALGRRESAAAVLARYRRLEAIPDDERQWDVAVRGAAALGASLREHRKEAVALPRAGHAARGRAAAGDARRPALAAARAATSWKRLCARSARRGRSRGCRSGVRA